MLVDSYLRACPRKWIQYLRYLESKLRHHRGRKDVSRYECVHGFAGSSLLSTACGAITEIPVECVHADWLSSIVKESKQLNVMLEEHWQKASAERARRFGEGHKIATHEVGSLVLLHRPFYERGLGAILPRCDGPFKIAAAPTAHSVVLFDPLTNEPHDGGKLVSVARLIRFNYPVDYATWSPAEAASRQEIIRSLKVGDLVAIELAKSRVNIARVHKTFREQGQAEVCVLEVSSKERFGPWTRRK